MAVLLSPEEWDSKRALEAHLDATHTTSIVLGQNAESPRRFYSLLLEQEKETTTVVVWSSGLGSKPSIAVFPDECALVGHDTWLTSLDLKGRTEIRSRRLGGVFYEFLPLHREHEVLVIHELGVMRVDLGGSVIWAVDTEVIEGWEVSETGDLTLTIMDRNERLGIRVDSGERFKPTPGAPKS